jgi:hypothetical protein
MKSFFLSICLLCGLAAAAQTQPASIGINTENPQGVLHIDGASTSATTNPPTGSISAARASDDVVIDASGRIGAGLLAPGASLDLYATAPGGALRLRDGTQGDRKVLISDAEGVATWVEAPGSWWYAALYMSTYAGGGSGGNQVSPGTYPVSNYGSSLISSTDQGSVDQAAGTITVPFTGKYRVTLSMHYMHRSTNNYWARTILRVRHSGITTSRWTPSVWGAAAGLGTLPTYSAIVELEAGDVLSMALDATLSLNARGGAAQVFMVEFIQ